MIMKKILLSFALTAAVMTAGAQIKELEPAEVFEWADPATIVEEEECEGCPEEEDCEGCPEDRAFISTTATPKARRRGKTIRASRN